MKIRHLQVCRIATVALTLGILCACGGKQPTTVERIDSLKKQVEHDAVALQEIEIKDYPRLEQEFMFCDSILPYTDSAHWDEYFQKLNLTHAYLKQFSDLNAEMRRKLDYSLQQLESLKADLSSHFLTDSLAQEYLETESHVADTLHNRILYFQDRFANCHKELATIKKALP